MHLSRVACCLVGLHIQCYFTTFLLQKYYEICISISIWPSLGNWKYAVLINFQLCRWSIILKLNWIKLPYFVWHIITSYDLGKIILFSMTLNSFISVQGEEIRKICKLLFMAGEGRGERWSAELFTLLVSFTDRKVGNDIQVVNVFSLPFFFSGKINVPNNFPFLVCCFVAFFKEKELFSVELYPTQTYRTIKFSVGLLFLATFVPTLFHKKNNNT